MKNKKLKIVVTGSHGYIGSEVVFRLKMLGFDPIGIDLKDGKNVLRNMPTCDVVIHCASRLDNDEDVIEYNVRTTEAVLKKAKRIVFLSSAAVYGDTFGAATENVPLTPINNYGESKLLCEKLIRKCKIPYTIFRLSNVYSFHGLHGVIPEWLDGGDVINGDGKQIRDFVRLEDIVPVISEAAITSKWRGIYNLSSGKGIEIRELFKKLFPKEKSVYEDEVKDEIQVSVLNSQKAQAKGFRPL